MTGQPIYEFSYDVDAVFHGITEEPERNAPEISIPLTAFAKASTMQALTRYLVDAQGLGFTEIARMLDRSPKSIWASYHQADPLGPLEEGIPIPVGIFRTGPPLEQLVRHLRQRGFRNVEIARALRLSPKTTHTAFKRAEVRR